MHRIACTTLFGLCLTFVLSAQDKPPSIPVNPVKVRIDTKQIRKSRSLPADATNLPSLSASDAFSNLVVAPGQTLTLTSSTDWTGADHVAVAIECPTSTSLQNTLIAIAWAVPLSNAPNYTATDVIVGKNLILPNMGGAVVPTYGPLLQIVVVNTGSAAIACDQLTAYAVVH